MKAGRAQQLIFNFLSISSILHSTNASLQAPSTGPIQSAVPSVTHISTWPNDPWTCAASILKFRSSYSTSARSLSAEPQFTYRIAASYSAKGRRLDPERNLFSYNPFVRLNRSADDKIDKRNRPKSGQDAFFVSPIGNSSSIAFGVVDGVGGWQDQGVDPADFAHGLCEYMAGGANTHPKDLPKGSLHPRDLLQFGYEKVMTDKSIVAGGSTACVATADSDGHVEIANLGDSGFIHFSVNAVRYVSESQTHAFNTPFQLSKIPKRQLQQMALFDAASALADLPRDANITHHYMQHGDVMVFASDGVWDNLSPQDLLTVVSRFMIELGGWVDTAEGFQAGQELKRLTEWGGLSYSRNNSLQSLLALAVTKEAKETSLNLKRDGPFAKEVQKYYPAENWHGGKPDDICVLVVIAVQGTDTN